MVRAVLLEKLSYSLGPENIASEPAEVRLGSRDLGRMMVVDRASGTIGHSNVLNLPDYLAAGDVVVLNNSKRLPGVLKTRTCDGAQVELRLTEMGPGNSFRARAFPAHFVRKGATLVSKSGASLHVTRANIKPYSLCELRCDRDVGDLLKAEGYPITSFFYAGYWDLDHYNPVYASDEGSVESPMAGLHFTDRLIDRLTRKGIHVAFVTLHVVGSWLPLLESDTQGHRAQSEDYFISEETARLIRSALRDGRRVVAVGSTTMRTLETAARKGALKAGAGKSRLFIEPGHQFKLVHSYFTNFHPARSSLMVLDAAFCPTRLLLRAYREARSAHYLFHEFGDAIFYI